MTEHDDVSRPIVECPVSLDGTWQRRGHASHNGVVTALSVDTGKCLDVETLANACKLAALCGRIRRTRHQKNTTRGN